MSDTKPTRVLFLAHGIGRHDKGWSKTVEDAIKEKASGLMSDSQTGFDADALRAELAQTEFAELYYDDLYQSFVKRMLEREGQFIKALELAGLPSLAKLFTENAAEADLLRDYVMDILIYRAMKEHRHMTRKHLALQMYQKLNEYGVSDVEYSVMAHSLGTAVIHDTLHEMSTESGSPYSLGFPFQVRCLFMVANTSALLRNDYDPRASNVRPFVGEFDPGYVAYYYNFAHRLDPVAQFYSYRAYMKEQPSKRFNFVDVEHFLHPNIHAYTHYLSTPLVYLRVLQGFFGDQLVPDSFVEKAEKAPIAELDEREKKALLDKLEPLLKTGIRPQLEGRANALITIASILKELL